jgi:diguanylate cyclase (GGDEF)-like protein
VRETPSICGRGDFFCFVSNYRRITRSKEGEKTMTMKLDILVVDDEPSISQLVETVLASDGHHVDVAHSGEEALEVFEKGNYALVISDVVMPGMSGIDLLKTIKQINADTQVIIMTSHTELNTAIEALRSSAYDYLKKPFDDISDISRVIQRAEEKIDLIQRNKLLLEELKLKNEEAVRMNEILRELAIQDGLTGLFNQRHFLELLGSEVERSKRYKHLFSLLFMAIDHFMKINDSLGHPAGDRALRGIAEILKKNTRKSNVVARYGFGTFAMIMPEISREEAVFFAERMRKLVAEHSFNGQEILPGGVITVSIGIATFPYDGIDRKSLVDQAGQALTEAQTSGKNKVC